MTSGTFTLDVDNAINATSSLYLDGGTLNLNLGMDSVGNLTLASGSMVGGGTLTVFGSPTKTTSGTATIGAGVTITSTSGCAVTAGNLLVDGTLSAGSTNVVIGATLGGGGASPGTVNSSLLPVLQVSGTISPGASYGSTGTGVLDTPSVNFSSDSIYAVDLNGTSPGSGYDQLASSGTVTLAGFTAPTLNVSVASGFNPPIGSTYTIIQAMAPISGTFARLPEGADFRASTGQFFQISYLDNAVTLTRVADDQVADTWVGGFLFSDDWNNPANWSLGSVPTPTQSVVIPGGISVPELTANVTVASLSMGSATLALNGFNLTVGNLTGSGVIADDSSTNATLTVDPAGTDTFAGSLTNGIGYSGGTRADHGRHGLPGSDRRQFLHRRHHGHFRSPHHGRGLQCVIQWQRPHRSWHRHRCWQFE